MLNTIIKQQQTANTTTTNASPTLIDNNGIPYVQAFQQDITVNVYSVETPCVVEGRIYSKRSANGVKETLKVSYNVNSQERAFVLSQAFVPNTPLETVLEYITADLDARLYGSVTKNSGQSRALIELLPGAKKDNAGWPVYWINESISLNRRKVTADKAYAVELAIKLSGVTTYFNAAPITNNNPTVLSEGTRGKSVNCLEPIPTLDFLQNVEYYMESARQSAAAMFK